MWRGRIQYVLPPGAGPDLGGPGGQVDDTAGHRAGLHQEGICAHRDGTVAGRLDGDPQTVAGSEPDGLGDMMREVANTTAAGCTGTATFHGVQRS